MTLRQSSAATIGVLSMVLMMQTSLAREDRASEDAPDVAAPQVAPIVDAFRRSSDLRLRLLFSMQDAHVEQDRFVQDEALPLEGLVERARGETDPLVLDLLSKRCDAQAAASARCDPRDIATRWTIADTQNQVAWLDLVDVLERRGETVAARDAFVRGSRASTWHEHVGELARIVVRALPSGLSDAQHGAALELALARASLVVPSSQTLMLGQFCRDGALHDACGRYVTTMVRDSPSLLAVGVAAVFAARAGLPDATVDRYQQESDALHWAARFWVDSLDPVGNDAAARNVRLEATIDDGERKVLEHLLAERRIATSDAAARYVATLGPDALKQHERRAQRP